jgi:hypothetical protein
MRARSAAGVAAVAVVAVLMSGCDAQAEPAARAVAEGFVRAVAAHRGATACALLAPETRSQLEQSAGMGCAAAILEEGLPQVGVVEDSVSFGTMGEVQFAEDTVFVAEFPGGWKVMAAGCSPVPGHPYDCRLQGG